MGMKPATDDLATWSIEITTSEGSQARTVRAAYGIPESGWLVFRNHRHQVVARFNEHLVISVTRADTLAEVIAGHGEKISDEDPHQEYQDALAVHARSPADVHAAAAAIEASITFRQHFTAAHPLSILHPAAVEFGRLAAEAIDNVSCAD